MEINFIIGLVGMSLILLGFSLVEFSKRYGQKSIEYNLINIFGASALIYYSYSIQGWPFLILNFVWAVVALIKLIEIKGK